MLGAWPATQTPRHLPAIAQVTQCTHSPGLAVPNSTCHLTWQGSPGLLSATLTRPAMTAGITPPISLAARGRAAACSRCCSRLALSAANACSRTMAAAHTLSAYYCCLKPSA
jgi:hypothetical protein